MMDPYYQDDYVTLYHGDCVEVMPSLADVDLVFTSPPYNMGRSAQDVDYRPGEGIHAGSLAASDLSDGYDGVGDSMPHADYATWQTEVLSLCWATFRPETAGDHPAPFPIELPATAIAAAAPSLVLDPFAGSGTTLRAAKDAGVQAVGIEQSERYCELIVDRLAQEVLPW